jgi:hypothetical protein
MAERVIKIAVVAATVMVAAPMTATASTVTAKWGESNSSKSCTGAIFHRIKESKMIAPAYVAERGQSKTISMAASTTADANTFGIKVWQPKGTRLKTYEKIGPIYVRTHHYRPQSHGRDVWVTKGLGNAGGKDRVKITECPTHG